MAKSIDGTVLFVEKYVDELLYNTYSKRYADSCMKRACRNCIRGNRNLVCESCPIKDAHEQALDYIKTYRTGIMEDFPVTAYA